MKIFSVLVVTLMVCGCSGGGGGTGGGSGGGTGGGAGGGAGGGSADAGPLNLLPAGSEASGRQVLITADGGVMVIGDIFRPDSGTEGDLLIARFSSTFVRDPAWGTEGVATVDFDGGSVGGILSLDNDWGAAGVFDGDKLVVVGSGRGEAGGGYDYAIARFTANGQPDPTFGSGGKVVLYNGMQNAGQLNNVVVTAAGKYLACGTVSGNHSLVRFNSDGTLDPTFTGSDAGVSADFGSTDELCGTLLMQGDKPLVAGRSFSIARFTAAGAVDTTFGTNGVYSTDGKLGGAVFRADGKIWLSGMKTVNTGGGDVSYLKQVLLTADGVPDTTFGTAGVLETQPANGISQVRGAALQGARLIVYIPSAPARLLRLNVDGSFDTAFGTSGAIEVPFSLPLFDQPFDPHHHLTVVGNTAWVTDRNLVKVTPSLVKGWLGLFQTPLP